MSHIFISYNRDDGDFAEILRREVAKAGFEPWIDMARLRAGEDWRAEIDQAIKEASALIVVMTPKAKESEYVTYEWAFALGAGVKAIPVPLKPTELHPRLGALQYLDFTNRMARPWDALIKVLEEAEAHSPQTVRVPSDVPLVIKQAVAALDSASPAERKAAVETLAQTDHPAAREALAEAVQHSIRDVRIHAAFALIQFKDARAVPGLIEALRDKDWSVRATAARALGHIGDAAAVPNLIDALRDTDWHVCAIAIEVLVAIGDAAVPSLLDALRDKDSNVRGYAAVALAKIGDATAVPGLVERLSDTEALRIEQLSDIEVLEAPSFLFFFDQHRPVCDIAAEALRQIGTPEALIAVEEWGAPPSGSRLGPIPEEEGMP